MEHVESEIKDNYDENLPFDKFSAPVNAPVFYKPKEVLWANLWLNRIAAAAVAITILVSIPEIIRMPFEIISRGILKLHIRNPFSERIGNDEIMDKITPNSVQETRHVISIDYRQ